MACARPGCRRNEPVRRLATILAADVAGYSRLMGEEKARIVEGLRKAGAPWAVTASSLLGSAEIEKTSKFLVTDHGLPRASLMNWTPFVGPRDVQFKV